MPNILFRLCLVLAAMLLSQSAGTAAGAFSLAPVRAVVQSDGGMLKPLLHEVAGKRKPPPRAAINAKKAKEQAGSRKKDIGVSRKGSNPNASRPGTIQKPNLGRRGVSEQAKQTAKLRLRAQALASHIEKTGTLPSSFITKNQAISLGWDAKKGNLHIVSPGKSIGGDRFHNREGSLPAAPGRIWREADIGYKSDFRNGNRLVYSSDGLMYLTRDHYRSFERIR